MVNNDTNIIIIARYYKSNIVARNIVSYPSYTWVVDILLG